MTSVKRISDLTGYASVLPYASELFGIYQPLLGWKSRRIRDRYREALRNDRPALRERLARRFSGVVELAFGANDKVEIKVQPGKARAGVLRRFDSLVVERIARRLPPHEAYTPEVWQEAITPEIIAGLLARDVPEFYARAFTELRHGKGPLGPLLRRLPRDPTATARTALDAQLLHESRMAGLLEALARDKDARALEDLFYATGDRSEAARRLARMLDSDDGVEAFVDIETLDPADSNHLASVALSPIGLVHLFRQYFFELDTFLGPPVGHVWLSPGSSVELIETHTRRTVTERTLATTLETSIRSETLTTSRDEISEAVKEENDNSISFGAGVKAKYGPVEATSNFDLKRSQRSAREVTHKQMREQSNKLASEIRRNVTSTFKVLTELTDVSSTKHLLANSTGELINYEMRRKVRQVGVQVQDIGSFLCWQAYVDDPGRTLGLAELIHIAAPPELDGLAHPEAIPRLDQMKEPRTVTIPFVSVTNSGADNAGEVYRDGKEVNNTEDNGTIEYIIWRFPQKFVPPGPDYRLAAVEFDPQGQPFELDHDGIVPSEGPAPAYEFGLLLRSANFEGKSSVQIPLVLHWSPLSSANEAIDEKNRKNLENFDEEKKAAYQRSYVESVKERVTAASRILPRRAEDLRDEERIAVYRQLVQDMLLGGIEFPDDRTRHVAAELVNAIFDVDKMLYFVAPEWWRPRRHRGRQQLREKPDLPVGPPVGPLASEAVREEGVLRKGLGEALVLHQPRSQEGLSSSRVGWGGVGDPDRDNYYVTEESEPAKLGSSLGWLLQLDGDNMRNAFLNAPWVKAVIPIRPGKEKAAINWLKSVEGTEGLGEDDVYRTDDPDERDVDGEPLDGKPMLHVLLDLAEKVRRKQEAGLETDRYPKAGDVADPALVDEENTVTATPVDRVFEHGFYPLQDGFRANVGDDYEIFDQWLEVLPTDQSVPVPVAYDPATGRQI